MGRVKLTITIDEALGDDLRRLAASRNASRSRLVEEALRTWSRQQRERALIDGYRAMAEEDRGTAEANLPAGVEVLE